jgi:hypothetical protein
MRAPTPNVPATLSAGLAAALVLLSAGIAPGVATANPNSAGGEQIVDCRLPPQLRSLGSRATYMAAGRQMKLSVSECKQRGGSWDGRGPGAYAGSSAAHPTGPMAVTVGSGGKDAACPLEGTVFGLKSGTLAVRAGPGTTFDRIDRLGNGTRVHLCDRAGEGDWVGVVYGSGDCGVSAPIDPPRAYSGACKSGWVRSTYLR